MRILTIRSSVHFPWVKKGGQDAGLGHRKAAVEAEARFMEAGKEAMLAREPLLLDAWFLLKRFSPDSPVNVRMQTWATYPVKKLLLVLHVMQLRAEGHARPLTF